MRRPASRAAGALALGAVLVALPGCGAHAQRRAVGTDVCVGAVPLGLRTAGPGAALVRVRRLRQRDGAALLPAPRGAATTSSGAAVALPPSLCALAYRGRFDPARLPAGVAVRGGTGPVLVLLTTVRRPQVLVAVVLPDLPPSLAR